MSIIWRITLIGWQYRTRLILAYISILVGVGLSLLIPKIVGVAIDKVVRYESGVDGGSMVSVDSTQLNLLIWLGLALLGASLLRGLFDFARTYTTANPSQIR